MDNELGYNDKMDAVDQVDAEEMIASMIFDYETGAQRMEGEEQELHEEDCAQLGRDILLAVLAEFRSDLVE